MRTATITEKGQISIPKDLRGMEGFQEGSKIAIVAFENKVELHPLKDFERIFSALASEKSLAKDWLSKEDEQAWKDL